MILAVVRAWCFVLGLAACASAPGPRPTLRDLVAAGELEAAFPACGEASVVARPDDTYAVSACYQVAVFHCPPGAAECALRSVDPVAVPAAVVVPAAPTGTASPAQLAEADRLFEDGRRLAKDQRQADACRRFARSDAIKRTFGTAVNLGDCAARDGQPGVAIALYDEAAQLASNPAQIKFVHDRGAALAPKLCTVVVTLADPGAAGLALRIGGRVQPLASEVRAMIAPGRAEVVVSAPGVYVRRWRITGVAGGVIELRVPALSPP